LAFDLQTGRPMKQHNASSAFVDILAAMTTRADECLLQISFGHA